MFSDTESMVEKSMKVETKEFKHKRLGSLMHYWKSLKKDDNLPNRKDIDPLDIPMILPYLMIIDVHLGRQNYNIRLMGTKAVENFERDYTGKNLLDFDLGGQEDIFYKALRRAAIDGKPVSEDFHLYSSDNMRVNYQALFLPISLDEPKQAEQVFIGFAFAPPFRDEE